MPLYYFHIYQRGTLIHDKEGSVCADLDAAKREARASATDLARQVLGQDQSMDDLCIEIHDEQDRVLAGLTIRDVLSDPDNPPFAPSCGAAGKGQLH